MLVGSNHFSIQMAAFNLFSVTKSSNNKSRDVVLPFRLCPSLLLYGALYCWLPGVWLLNKLIQPIIKVRLMEDFCPNNSPASFFTTLAVLLLLLQATYSLTWKKNTLCFLKYYYYEIFLGFYKMWSPPLTELKKILRYVNKRQWTRPFWKREYTFFQIRP